MATKAANNVTDPKDETKVCKVCKLAFPDIYAYVEHLESKQHEKGSMKLKYGKKYLAAKAKLDGNILEEKTGTPDKTLHASEENSEPVKKAPENVENIESSVNSSDGRCSGSDSYVDDDEVYTCNVCQKICTGFITYELHLQGKKHRKNVKKINILEKMENEKSLPETKNETEDPLWDQFLPQSRHNSPTLVCDVCKKKCLGPEAYRQHCQSESHKKKIATKDLLKSMETEGLSPAKNQDDDEPFAHCDICNKDFSGPVPYMQHIKSVYHEKQKQRMKQVNDMQDLVISKENNSKFECKECGKVFSGPIPFNAHLKSSAHGKKKKKNALIDDLEKKYPQLIKTAALENSDDSTDDDSIQLGCKVCHVVFSGPEAANDHFTSSKHQKAVKRKEKFKNFKQLQKNEKLLASSNGGKKTEKYDSDENSDFDIISVP